jgi:prophage DNA circulation protein
MDKIEIIADVITGEVTQTVSQFTSEELAYSAQVTAQQQADAQAVIDTKASALAKLTALGLTQDEVKALVG